MGTITVGKQSYVTSIDAGPKGRYLYFSAGAHGGAINDGTPVVQYDTQTKKKTIIVKLHPFYKDKYGYSPDGTFGSAVSPDGSMVFVGWNGNRTGNLGSKYWDTCAMTVIHVPASMRK